MTAEWSAAFKASPEVDRPVFVERRQFPRPVIPEFCTCEWELIHDPDRLTRRVRFADPDCPIHEDWRP